LGTDRFRPSGIENVEEIVFSPDGAVLAATTREGKIHLFSTSDGRGIGVLDGGSKVAFRGAKEPRGLRQRSGRVEAVDWENGKEIRTFALGALTRETDRASYTQGELSPDGRRAALMYSDSSLEVWDVEGAARAYTLPPAAAGHRVEFSPDGALLATAGTDGQLRVYDAAGGAAKATLRVGSILSVAFLPEGRLAWGVSEAKRALLRVHDLAAGRTETLELGGLERSANSLAVPRDGRSIAVGAWDGGVRAFDLATKREIFALQRPGTQGFPLRLAYSPDGRRLAGGGPFGVQIWDAATGKPSPADVGHRTAVLGIAFGPDGRTLRSWGRDGTLREWDARAGKQTRVTDGDVQMVYSRAFSPAGDLVTGDGGGNMSIRSADGAERLRLKLPEGTVVSALAYSPAGTLIASANFSDNLASRIRVWDAATGRERAAATGAEEAVVQALAFSPGGRILAAGGMGGRIRLLDPASLKERRSLDIPWRAVASLAFSDDGLLLAAAGGDHDPRFNPGQKGVFEARIWDALDGRLLSSVAGPAEGVGALAFAPGRRLLALSGFDASVRLLEVPGGAELARFSGHSQPVLCISFSPDGSTLATGGADTTIRLWRTPATRPVPAAPPGSLDQLWEDLAGPEAFAAGERLAARGDVEAVVRFLRAKLELPRAGAAPGLIAKLDDEDPAAREEAARALEALGLSAAADLREASDRAGPDAAGRARGILGRLEVSAALSRRARAIEALRRLDPAAARELAERSPFESERARLR
jgi:WD40 repeat protein